MDNDQIQQTNLVSDDAAAAMTDTVQPEIIQPENPTPEPATAPTDVPQPAGPPATEQPAEPVVATPEPTTEPASSTDDTSDESTNDLSELDDIKKSALDDLQPLIEHVEQSPEERFETVMMMIRSNDDPKLISQAYEAAKGIENEKVRANALLNIVSEIEYLKSKQNNQN